MTYTNTPLSAAKAGLLATVAMETFLRATDPFVRHRVNFAWMQGTALGLPSKSKVTLASGYLVYFTGGIVFANIYQRIVPVKTPLTGIAYSLIFPLGLVNGLIMMPIVSVLHPLVRKRKIPKPGLFGLGLGLKAFLFNLYSHIIYGAVLGSTNKPLSCTCPLRHKRKTPYESLR